MPNDLVHFLVDADRMEFISGDGDDHDAGYLVFPVGDAAIVVIHLEAARGGAVFANESPFLGGCL